MTLRCIEKKRRKIGAMAITEAAIMSANSLECCPARVAMPTLNGIGSSRAVTINGHSKSFQDHNTVVIMTANKPGLTTGTMTRQNVCHGLQPSSLAASSSSAGRLMKDCRMRNTPKAEKKPGRTMPHGVSNNPSSRMISYWPMRYDCPGTMRIARTNPKRTDLPPNFIRAKAYPPIEHRISWTTVLNIVIVTDTPNCLRKGRRVNTSV